jgi:hypothetical protein
MYDVIFVLLALLSLIFGLSVSKDIATLDKTKTLHESDISQLNLKLIQKRVNRLCSILEDC